MRAVVDFTTLASSSVPANGSSGPRSSLQSDPASTRRFGETNHTPSEYKGDEIKSAVTNSIDIATLLLSEELVNATEVCEAELKVSSEHAPKSKSAAKSGDFKSPSGTIGNADSDISEDEGGVDEAELARMQAAAEARKLLEDARRSLEALGASGGARRHVESGTESSNGTSSLPSEKGSGSSSAALSRATSGGPSTGPSEPPSRGSRRRKRREHRAAQLEVRYLCILLDVQGARSFTWISFWHRKPGSPPQRRRRQKQLL